VRHLLIRTALSGQEDVVACDPSLARCAAMVDDTGQRVKLDGPPPPWSFLGLQECPTAGATNFEVYCRHEAARAVVGMSSRATPQRRWAPGDSPGQQMAFRRRVGWLSIVSGPASEDESFKELNTLILKADVQAQALRAILGFARNNCPRGEVQVRCCLGTRTKINRNRRGSFACRLRGGDRGLQHSMASRVPRRRADCQRRRRARDYEVIYKLWKDIQSRWRAY